MKSSGDSPRIGRAIRGSVFTAPVVGQGVEAWGRSGVQKLWSSSKVRIYGGGEADADFLNRLSRLVGEHDHLTHSRTCERHGHGGSRTTSARRQRIYDIADLQALPRGRALVLPSGAPPVLIQTCPG